MRHRWLATVDGKMIGNRGEWRGGVKFRSPGVWRPFHLSENKINNKSIIIGIQCIRSSSPYYCCVLISLSKYIYIYILYIDIYILYIDRYILYIYIDYIYIDYIDRYR